LNLETRKRLVRVARGLEPADVCIRNAQIVDVHTLSVYPANVSIADGLIALVGEPCETAQVIDAHGAFLTPGLIDAHIHIESSMMTPRRFAEAVVPRGTIGVVCEPHEIANVIGLAGVEAMLTAGRSTPLRLWASVPSCVPASPFEHSGAHMTPSDVRTGLRLEGALGLAEMMNYPGVLEIHEGVWSVLEAARGTLRAGDRFDGHAPGLRGRDYQAYVAAGMHSDHEAVTEEEALERLRAGTWLMVRDGSAARNLETLATLLKRVRPTRAMLVTDDIDASELVGRGHADRLLQKAVQHGLDAAYAVRLMTLAPSEYWGLHDRGAVTPGSIADLVLFKDLESFQALWVMREGEIIARDGVLVQPAQGFSFPDRAYQSVRLPADWNQKQLEAKPRKRPVIGVKFDQIYTETFEKLALLEADPARDLVKIAMVERHSGSGRTGVGFASGLGLQRGAIAQTIAHDSHNIIVVGVNDNDMATAVRVLERINGGVVVVLDGEAIAWLELPIAGLMSDAPPEVIANAQREVEEAMFGLGCNLPNPILTLSFLGLTVIPDLKITDQGLFDVRAFKLLDSSSNVMN
jgi:adenine deaminase